jgi:peptide/nickel transport system substrate-binding protein
MLPVLDRRNFLRLAGSQAALAALGVPAWAQARDAITIAFSTDVPTWDPDARVLAGAQSLYKCVFDGVLTQAPNLAVQPSLAKAWKYRDPASLELEIELRDNVLFHNGDKMTAEDFRYSFFERPHAPVPPGGQKLDTGFIWRRIKDIEIVNPTRVVVHFTEVMPSALAWFYFMACYVEPKNYFEKAGLDGFLKQPIGTGPYRLVEYQQGTRLVLEAHAKYWAGAPKLKRVTIEIVKDPSARVAAIDSRRVDLAVDLPIREVTRLGATPGLVGSVDPITDIMIIEVTRTGPFEQEPVRLAAHHAIDKAAISRALFAGKARAIAAPAAHGTPGYPKDFTFAYDPAKAQALLKQAGFSPANPAKIGFATTNGIFPNDYEMARAIVAMWKKVGIEANLEVIELVTYQERLRANKLPEAMMYQWGNTTGDPEMYGGYLFDPKSIFATWKSDDLGDKVHALLVETNQQKRYAGYRDLAVYAVNKGYSIPLFQGVKTAAYQSKLAFTKYDNGWILPQAYALKA